jgi:hypothetical protein
LETLAAAGFAYDSSIYPGLHDRFGWLGAPRTPVRVDGMSLIEFPVPVLGPLMPIAFSGGGYLRLLPWFLIAWGFSRHSHQRTPGMIYAHPWEIEAASGRRKQKTFGQNQRNWFELRQSFTGRLRRHEMRSRLERLLKFSGCHLMPMGRVVSSLQDLPQWNPKSPTTQFKRQREPTSEVCRLM